jgi:hypothetical protein
MASALIRYYTTLWGYFKDIVNKTSVTFLDQLKLRIVAEIERVNTANAGEHLEGN